MIKTAQKTAAALLAVLLIPLSVGATFIKWVDCSVSSGVLGKMYELCVKYHDTENAFDFPSGIAYIATRNGNRFTKKDSRYIAEFEGLLKKGDPFEKCRNNKYFRYHEEAYSAILKNFVAPYREAGSDKIGFGLTAYHPIARGYGYNDYDDFGSNRSFGFKRKHLGHDIMGGVGTPIVAVEGGTVTELGWNRYGGWRIGITSFDGKRYYYYAHLRKGRPYADGLEKGASVSAGQLIGFLGATGYSDKEDVDLKNCAPHLHFGMQLIFDESQKDGNGEIWIDVYAVCKFLSRNRARVVKDENGNLHSENLREIVTLPNKTPL